MFTSTMKIFFTQSLFDLGTFDLVTTVRKMYLRNFETDIRICWFKAIQFEIF